MKLGYSYHRYNFFTIEDAVLNANRWAAAHPNSQMAVAIRGLAAARKSEDEARLAEAEAEVEAALAAFYPKGIEGLRSICWQAGVTWEVVY